MGDVEFLPFQAGALQLEADAKLFKQQKYMNGFMPGGDTRQDDDFYPTPPAGTEAFMRAEGHMIARCFGRVWENACGEGDCAKVMIRHGIKVIATDLIDRGYGEGGRDFLKEPKALAPAIVTNPPYCDKLPQQFVMHAKKLGVKYVALLLKADFWNAQNRVPFWESFEPARIHPVSFRLDFLGGGGGPMNVSWNVWDWREDQPKGCRHMRPLPKPGNNRELFGDRP